MQQTITALLKLQLEYCSKFNRNHSPSLKLAENPVLKLSRFPSILWLWLDHDHRYWTSKHFFIKRIAEKEVFMLESKHLSRTLVEKFLDHDDNGLSSVFFPLAFLAYYREPSVLHGFLVNPSLILFLPHRFLSISWAAMTKFLFFSVFFCALYTLWLYFCVSSQESM